MNLSTDIFSHEALTLDGRPLSLAEFRGKVLLVVNVASKCGFTPQYEGLEALYRELSPRGLVILGFPCNQFLHQEPGSEAEIGSFCSRTFGVSFPLFAKVDVNGRNAHPLFRTLTSSLPGALGTKFIKWNFTKFLVDRNGVPRARFAPRTTPQEMRAAIEALL